MNNRYSINLIFGALCLALLISSCSQGTTTGAPAADSTPSFEFNAEEQAAFAAGDDSSLTVEFGDSSLGPVYFEAAPSAAQIAQLQGQSLQPERSASTAVTCNNNPCTCPCRKVVGICNLTERLTQLDDCCDISTSIEYVGQVKFEDSDAHKSGVEVIFKRGGQEVGRATTDAQGIAKFTENNVPRGAHKVTVCVAPGTTGSCATSTKGCAGIVDATFSQTSVTAVSVNRELSNVVIKFCDGSVQKFDGLRGYMGTFFGTGSNSGKTIAGAWIKSGCNESGDGPGYGEWKPNPTANCDCKCADPCDNCTTTLKDGMFCADLNIGVSTDCIYGAVTGTGYINACNPLRIGSRAGMNFRAAYNNGAVQGYLNFWDGSIKVTNGQIKWMTIAAPDAWFGGDNWIVHVVDNGKDFRNDTFEIWITDPVTGCCYHCGGRLVGCYVNISFRYTQVCP